MRSFSRDFSTPGLPNTQCQGHHGFTTMDSRPRQGTRKDVPTGNMRAIHRLGTFIYFYWQLFRSSDLMQLSCYQSSKTDLKNKNVLILGMFVLTAWWLWPSVVPVVRCQLQHVNIWQAFRHPGQDTSKPLEASSKTKKDINQAIRLGADPAQIPRLVNLLQCLPSLISFGGWPMPTLRSNITRDVCYQIDNMYRCQGALDLTWRPQ